MMNEYICHIQFLLIVSPFQLLSIADAALKMSALKYCDFKLCIQTNETELVKFSPFLCFNNEI